MDAAAARRADFELLRDRASRGVFDRVNREMADAAVNAEGQER